MRKKIFLTAMLTALLAPDVFSQSFSVEANSVDIYYSEPVYRINHIFSPGTRHINWSVVDSDFPLDWLMNTAFCDYNACYTADQLYPTGTMLDCYFPDGDEVGIGYGFNFDQIRSTGSHFIRLRLTDVDDGSSVADETYFVSNGSPKPGVTTSMFNATIFPNPAKNSVTVNNPRELNASTVAIINVMGAKMIEVSCHVGDNLVNISSLPSGIYTVHLKSAKGEVIRTEKLVCEK